MSVGKTIALIVVVAIVLGFFAGNIAKGTIAISEAISNLVMRNAFWVLAVVLGFVGLLKFSQNELDNKKDMDAVVGISLVLGVLFIFFAQAKGLFSTFATIGGIEFTTTQVDVATVITGSLVIGFGLAISEYLKRKI